MIELLLLEQKMFNNVQKYIQKWYYSLKLVLFYKI